MIPKKVTMAVVPRIFVASVYLNPESRKQGRRLNRATVDEDAITSCPEDRPENLIRILGSSYFLESLRFLFFFFFFFYLSLLFLGLLLVIPCPYIVGFACTCFQSLRAHSNGDNTTTSRRRLDNRR
ncbi:hypothetical protein GQ53DRAFT_63050 [Thozetella sp. PMI_491]|nr:hypothetical protein GQ53DRAFT_63050 [Thozetella sp. PMI_491]